MANGEIGLLSQSAVKVVEEDTRFAQELVTTHHHKTEEKIVKDQLHKVKHATWNFAQVKTCIENLHILRLKNNNKLLLIVTIRRGCC